MKDRTFTVLFLLLTVLLLTVPVCANAAEPPNVLLRVTGAPQDFTVTLESEEDRTFSAQGIGFPRVWETTYQYWWRTDGPENWKNLRLHASSGEESFEIPVPDEWIDGYASRLSLNWKTRELTSGDYPGRYVLIVLSRVIATLLIEGLVFFLFGYRNRRSWIVFFCINLTTQAFLNWALSGILDYQSYTPMLAFIASEIVIVIAECIAFPLLTKEKGKGKTVLYAFCANLVSLAAGGWMLSNLPI